MQVLILKVKQKKIIFDEEINPSERKEYDNVSSVTFVIEDIDGKKNIRKLLEF